MSKQHHSNHGEFAIGRPVPRKEDINLLRGRGRYADDVNLPNQAYASFVRSQVAHGTISRIDREAALASPGVLGIWVGKDLEVAGYGGIKCTINLSNRDGSPMRKPMRPALALDKVRWVGDPIAMVVARTAIEAKDAAELVEVEIDPLTSVTNAADAVKPGAPQLFNDVPANIALDYHYGDTQKVAEAFTAATHRVKLNALNNRIVVSPMEPRAAVGEFDADRWSLYTGCQGVFGLRGAMAEILHVPPDRVRIITGNVGGSFGMKSAAYPEYIAVLHAAKQLGRPVKWTDERSGSFLSDQHGRDQEAVAELALDGDGKFLAVRICNIGNMGAYLSAVAPLMPALNIVKNLIGVYQTPLLEVSAKCVFTNTPPVSSYRGAGRPEANYLMERLIDAAAAQTGIDRLELRRRNHIRPEQIPYTTPSGLKYDSGDFPILFEKALELADWNGSVQRKRDSLARGKLRGIAIGSYVETTAPPGGEMGGIRFDGDGRVTIISGTLDYGQGHATPFAQVLSDRLGIPFDSISLLQGDSDALIAGAGSGGSRSITASGQAIDEASHQVIALGKRAAAYFLEASEIDITFVRGDFTVVGTDRSIHIMELARWLASADTLPEGVPRSLSVNHKTGTVEAAFPNGCHVAEVEIDPETGVVSVVRYSSANDFGTVVNPLLVEGQVHGGVAQGIGQAIMERVVYDDIGQLLTGSFMDYALPHAADLLNFDMVNHAVPATTNVLGTKGCGEAGSTGAMVCVMNAIIDALSPLGIRTLDMPATPARIWEAIQAARSVQVG